MATQADSSVRLVQLPLALRNLAELAGLLERLERSGHAPDPHQYRELVARIGSELQARPRDAAMDELLSYFPAAAELYENLNYASAGLCRWPLEQSVESERTAKALLARVAHQAPDTAA